MPRRQIRIAGSRTVWLTLGLISTAALMFALGVVVGKRAARLAPQPVSDPLAAIEANGKIQEQLTFYNRLAKSPAAKPSAAPTQPRAQVPMSVESVRTDQSERTAITHDETEATPPVAKPPPSSPDGPDEDRVRSALGNGPANHGEFTVQVSSFQTEKEANAAAASLRRKGYLPFVVGADVSGRGMWYRVRLGSFSNHNDAARAKIILAQAEIPAWILKVE